MRRIKISYNNWKRRRVIKDMISRLHYVEDCLQDIECMLKGIHLLAENSADFLPLQDTARLRVGIRRVILKELKDLKQEVEEIHVRIKGLPAGEDV